LTIDSKAVDKALGKTLWPALRAVGFDRRTGRTAWRDQPDSIGTVNVQSFNSYLAGVLGSTTYSFSIRVSVFFPAIAKRSLMGRYVKDWLRPKEPLCQARKSLEKGIEQPAVGADLGWQDRPDIWFVVPDGSNIDAVVTDARDRFLADGRPWLDELADLGEATRRFLETPDRFGDRGVMLENYAGRLGSPGRMQAAGALAAERGERAVLERVVSEMDSQDYWDRHQEDRDRLRADLREMLAGNS
jgi:hypothetical protein